MTESHIKEILERIEDTNNEAHLALHGLIKGLDTKLGIQNGRVSALERWRAYIAGAMAVILIVVVPLVLSSMREAFAR